MKRMTGYEDLANAIILQAAKDYRAARCKLKKNPNNHTAQTEIDSVERFFRSKWYRCLTEIDGEMLIKKLKEEV